MYFNTVWLFQDIKTKCRDGQLNRFKNNICIIYVSVTKGSRELFRTFYSSDLNKAKQINICTFCAKAKIEFSSCVSFCIPHSFTHCIWHFICFEQFSYTLNTLWRCPLVRNSLKILASVKRMIFNVYLVNICWKTKLVINIYIYWIINVIYLRINCCFFWHADLENS